MREREKWKMAMEVQMAWIGPSNQVLNQLILVAYDRCIYIMIFIDPSSFMNIIIYIALDSRVARNVRTGRSSYPLRAQGELTRPWMNQLLLLLTDAIPFLLFCSTPLTITTPLLHARKRSLFFSHGMISFMNFKQYVLIFFGGLQFFY